jgi:F0F1-type ATP synthase assembly protein I
MSTPPEGKPPMRGAVAGMMLLGTIVTGVAVGLGIGLLVGAVAPCVALGALLGIVGGTLGVIQRFRDL